jgi:hypothetical protein
MINLNDASEYIEGRQYDQDAISRDLALSADRWVRELFPNGRVGDDGKWHVADIAGHAPKKNGSCAINLTGEYAGCWVDWSGGSDAKGRSISTIKEHFRLEGPWIFEKCIAILHELGFGGSYLLDEASQRPNGHANGLFAAAAAPIANSKDEAEINFILENSISIIGAQPEIYLRKRAGFIPPAAFGEDPDLLFHPDCVRRRSENRGHPTLIARFRYPDGRRSKGIHRIFLLADGSHHLGDKNAKKMKGDGLCQRTVVMLAPIDPANGTLGVGTGIETTLAAMKLYQTAGWSARSDGGMKEFAEWLRASNGYVAAGPDGDLIHLQKLLIWADRGNDGEKAGRRLHHVARSLGITVKLYLPIGPDDFADDLANKLPPSQPEPEPAEKARELPLRVGVPEIKVGGGQLPQNVDFAEMYLADSDKDVFQRGDFLVRPAKAIIQISHSRKAFAKRLVRISVQHLIDRLTRIIDFKKYDARKDDWFSINCPADIAASLLERRGMWNALPHIRGIITAPTLRWDGTLFNKPGYDQETGILFDPGDINYYDLEIPTEPSIDQARKALNILKSLINEFPFVDEHGNDATGKPSASRSVSLSHMLTAAIRLSIVRAPLHGFSATAAGSGKSLLVDTSSMIATGHECPVISPGGNPEEMEKRLGAALLAGDTQISFDNCETALGGEKLNQVLTQSLVQIRILGKSEQPTVPSDALFSATGQNLTVIGDMARRTIMAVLDPKMERPETRTFNSETPVARVRSNRALYVAAVLTVLRAFHVAGRPQQTTPLGSFEEWSGWVRDALIWLGEPDPCDTMERTRQGDPRRRELASVLHQWREVIGEGEVTAKRVIEYATEFEPHHGNLNLNPLTMKHPDFREALLVVAGDKGAVNSRKLGYWLRGIRGRVVDRMRIEEGKMLGGDNRWRLVIV